MNDGFELWAEERLVRYGGTDAEILTDCPWCGRPKLYVNPGKGVFFCQRCRETGGGARLVAKIEGTSLEEAKSRLTLTPQDADELLKQLIEASSSSSSRRDDQADTPSHPLPEGFVPCFDGEWWRLPSYLSDPLPEGRGLDELAIVRHGLGYVEEGRYRNRVVVPVITGTHRTFLARLMGRPREFAWTSKSGELVEPPKYLTPRGADLARTLYLLDHLPDDGHIIVVEGVFDAIRLAGFGFPAVASFGKHLSRDQIRLIRGKRPRRVTLFRDSDAEADGWANAEELRRRLRRGTKIDVAICPPGHDPDSLGFELGRRGLRRVLEETAPHDGGVAALEAALRAIS